ncbi:unnamed protein product, partial [Schistosoma turkestanicum]
QFLRVFKSDDNAVEDRCYNRHRERTHSESIFYMYRYIGTYVCLLSILITCNLNFIFQHGKSNFATANVLFSAPQLSVVTGLKAHALFLTIHVHPSASPRTCFKSIMKIRV